LRPGAQDSRWRHHGIIAALRLPGAALRIAQLVERGVPKRYFFVDPANRAAQGLAEKLGCELVQAGVDIDFR
jgi:RimJ/RimL family protein N-acetyltransferase